MDWLEITNCSPFHEQTLLPHFPVLKMGEAGRGQGEKNMQKPKCSTPKMLHRAGELRKEPTPAEAKLAYLRLLREEGIHFRRQHAIGNYIVDFCAPGQKLIIELDGSQHIDQEEYDAERTAYLEQRGYRVLRFWNGDVMNDINGVAGVIHDSIQGKLSEFFRASSLAGVDLDRDKNLPPDRAKL
jgi:very-short-patch-repair endonuclease